MSDNAKWVQLAHFGNVLSGETMGAVDAAIKCRRVVEVRRTSTGGLAYFARVPVPKAVAEAIKPAVRRTA